MGNYLINEYYQNKKKICFRAFLQRLTAASGRHSKSQLLQYDFTVVRLIFSRETEPHSNAKVKDLEEAPCMLRISLEIT